jgi:hypothetical protein
MSVLDRGLGCDTLHPSTVRNPYYNMTTDLCNGWTKNIGSVCILMSALVIRYTCFNSDLGGVDSRTGWSNVVLEQPLVGYKFSKGITDSVHYSVQEGILVLISQLIIRTPNRIPTSANLALCRVVNCKNFSLKYLNLQMRATIGDGFIVCLR